MDTQYQAQHQTQQQTQHPMLMGERSTPIIIVDGNRGPIMNPEIRLAAAPIRYAPVPKAHERASPHSSSESSDGSEDIQHARHMRMPAVVGLPVVHQHRAHGRKNAESDNSDDSDEPAQARPRNVPNIRQNIQQNNAPILPPDDWFWAQIASFNWHNSSDGPIARRPIAATIASWNQQQRAMWMEYYHKYANAVARTLTADNMFDRNGIVMDVDRARVISHAIALGRDQYATLLGDNEIFQFLIEGGECLSLDELLPKELRYIA